ncbi:23S ribosomal RNA methyltransferase Erm [Glutamicibacter sp. HZAU]|uniref:23S ribosomal RNA methyltransferase Erm n=1 Tax=Glutamicibacter sp. HZAU TaxID=2049891 RepID=UPI000FFC9D15|nr:23S ribosomal RNA methyltransferase Erm [Glutamicibacter sp. HZAU]RWZ79515.1 23S ribosomal RNA methyltransferase Erm [Glutamicibacter sp. HZAU]
MPRSSHGGRHELGQNFINHQPTIRQFTKVVEETSGTILEIGAGNGALTKSLITLGRPLTAIDLDEHRIEQLQRSLPNVSLIHADAMTYPLEAQTVVGNIPFHLTTPILRRLLMEPHWEHAVLLTQWEVAKKRAGVGGSTLLTAQNAPWFTFELHGRVPAHRFTPRPSVDGGILKVVRREKPLVPLLKRKNFEKFVSAVFSGRGGTMDRILRNVSGHNRAVVQDSMSAAKIGPHSLPRDLTPDSWSRLWEKLQHPTVPTRSQRRTYRGNSN